jgi:hypothetical protein
VIDSGAALSAVPAVRVAALRTLHAATATASSAANRFFLIGGLLCRICRFERYRFTDSLLKIGVNEQTAVRGYNR